MFTHGLNYIKDDYFGHFDILNKKVIRHENVIALTDLHVGYIT